MGENRTVRPSVTPFHSQLPVRIAFGDGVIAELPGALEALGATSALVVVEEPVAGARGGRLPRSPPPRARGVRLERVVKGPGRADVRARRRARRTRARRRPRRCRRYRRRLGARRRQGGAHRRRPGRRGRRLRGRRADAGTAADRARPVPDDVGDGERGVGGERPDGHRAGPEDRLRSPEHARAACARRSGAHARSPSGPDGALGRRRDGAGDRGVHGRELVAALGRVRPRGLSSRRRLAARRRSRTGRTPRRAGGSPSRASPRGSR